MSNNHLEILMPPIRPMVRGYFKLVGTKPDGRQRVIADWFPNLITDGGLNRMGIGPFRNRCFVGTGSAAPLATDTQLQTRVANAQNSAPAIPGQTMANTAPYWAQVHTGFRFAVGAAAGNLTEVGIGWDFNPYGANDYELWSRALILDEHNAPTAVTVLADEVLDVYYAMRIYPPAGDATYQVTIAGEVYDCITRASMVTSVYNWYVPSDRVLFVAPSGNQHTVYSGLIGTVTGSPSGLSHSHYGGGIANAPYSNNSLQQDATHSWGLNDSNVAGGIRSIQYYTNIGAYQTQYTLATPRMDGSVSIPKDATKVMSLGFRVGWARRP